MANELNLGPSELHMMLTCIKENVENTLPEYYAVKRRYLQLLGVYTHAAAMLNLLYEQDRILEYQIALNYFYEIGKETYECLYNLQNLKIQMFNSARSFFHFGNPSELQIATEFVALIRSFLDQEEDFEQQTI
ncbi:hypothetical protein KR200_002719 [Drosophila serrata]|nr:hypothetical protein KR200_002719 [Drosophila serrata]